MKKWMASLLAALVLARSAGLPLTTQPVMAEVVQSDELAVDEQDATEEQTQASDPEWKYVPIRRSAAADNSPDYFDGRLLTADDLTRD